MAERVILGIDEVGRGPWAGPLVVGAVILGEAGITNEEQFLWQNLADSKQITAKKREELCTLIKKYAAAYATGWVSAAELDCYGLSASLKLATRRAVKQILARKVYFSEIIIDGTVNFLQSTPLANRVTVLKKADSLIKEVSAASIVAKVARDQYMHDQDAKYPEYGFAQHVGYGTAKHRTALTKSGICPEHRQSFRPVAHIMKTVSQGEYVVPLRRPKSQTAVITNSTLRGRRAETAVRKYLIQQGHQILAQNYRTDSYEIDLISLNGQTLYFTEVKYSYNLATEGTALARITLAKKAQMRFAAEHFIAQHPLDHDYKIELAAAAVHGADYQVSSWIVVE